MSPREAELTAELRDLLEQRLNVLYSLQTTANAGKATLPNDVADRERLDLLIDVCRTRIELAKLDTTEDAQ